jgi:small nuclear ribonucleoprotein (snRNP)-like protein
MAPKKQSKGGKAHVDAAALSLAMEQAAAVAAAQMPSPAAEEPVPLPSPLLEKPTLIVLEDGREVYGLLVAFDSQCNVLLQSVTERRRYPSSVAGEPDTITQRSSVSLAVPAKYIKRFYQRPEGNVPAEIEAVVEHARAKQQLQEEQAAAAAAASATATA